MCWELVCEPGAGAEGGLEGAGRLSWGEARKQECGEEVLLHQVLRKDTARWKVSQTFSFLNWCSFISEQMIKPDSLELS